MKLCALTTIGCLWTIFCTSAEAPASTGALNLRRMQHQIATHDQEIEQLQQRFENNESSLEMMRQEVQALLKATKEVASDAHVQKLEIGLNKVVGDIKVFQKHVNETITSIHAVTEKMAAQQTMIQSQCKQIQDLEKAVRALTQILQKPSAVEKGLYRVKSGDSLERIAKEHGTTAQLIKELNQLKSDTIYAGQQLKLPE